MAKIAKAEHARIQEMATTEGRKVAEIAAIYDCTPANIYTILAKLRRNAASTAILPLPEIGSAEPQQAAGEPPEAVPPITSMPALLAAEVQEPAAEDALAGDGEADGTVSEALAPSQPQQEAPAALAETAATEAASVAPVGPRPVAKQASQPAISLKDRKASPSTPPRAAKPGRPGYALHMRTSDGEEAVTPFRSLDDLLSAARPVLRSAARSPEPIWFSIQPADLADMDNEAA